MKILKMRGKYPSTEQVFGRECDCQKSLGVIKKFFEIFQDSLKTSGILNNSKKEGKAKRKNYGGKPARARRRERRAEERRRATTLSTSPPPFDTSAVVIDAVGEYMGGSDAWIDMGGHIKDEVKVVGQQFGNNFTQAGQLQGDRQLQGDQLQGDRLECDRQSPSLSNYNNSISLESKEDLSAKPWYFDCIPLQSAKELLYDFGKIKSFLMYDTTL